MVNLFSLILYAVPSREYIGFKEFNPLNLFILNLIFSISIIIIYLIKKIYKKTNKEKQ